MDDKNRIPRCEDDMAFAAWCTENGVRPRDFEHWLNQNDIDNPSPGPYPDNSGMRIREKSSPHANILTEVELTPKEEFIAAAMCVAITLGLACMLVGAYTIAQWIWRCL